MGESIAADMERVQGQFGAVGLVGAECSDDLLDQARAWLDRRRLTALTGAGISTDSGIPDFRGPSGTWTLDPSAEKLSRLDDYVGDIEVRKEAWRRRVNSPTWSARPNAGHLALARMASQDRLVGVVTQNIDELHQAAGHDRASVVELHGSLHRARCLSCGERTAMAEMLSRVRQGEDDPRCQSLIADKGACGGVIKSDTISFGEPLDPAVWQNALGLVSTADVLLVAGTSLSVHPAAGLVPFAHRQGIPVMICNAEPTPYDGLARFVLRGPLSTTLSRLVGPGIV